VREIDDLPATVWWGVQVRQSRLHTCTVHCTRAGILCSSALARFTLGNTALEQHGPPFARHSIRLETQLSWAAHEYLLLLYS
jgi:hypothetical protein